MAWDGPLRQIAPAVHDIPQDYQGQDGKLRMNVPGRIFAGGDLLSHITDDLAPEQVANVASLPGIVGASMAMPDIHWGYGFPIGGVAAFDPDEGGVVSPGGVGFDINCGVRLVATDLEVDDVRPRLEELADALYASVPAGLGSRGSGRVSSGDLDEILAAGAGWAVQHGYATSQDRKAMESRGRVHGADPAQVGERARLRGKRTLGSLGSGNHFMEVQRVDEIMDEAAAAAYGVRPDQVVVMIHTGSRGLGHQVCQDTIPIMRQVAAREGIGLVDPQLACAPLGSAEAEAYMAAMAAAANFAFCNRSILTHHLRLELDRLFGADGKVVYDVCHNIAKWEDHQVDGRRRRLCVHRKGATRAFAGETGTADLAARFHDVGQPVIVPGDMGRRSFLLAANPEAMTTSFGSSCHGAGRRLSRTAAKKQWSGADLIQQLREQGIIVKATSNNVAAEEAPDAYKDVSEVVESVRQAGLARPVARLRPMAVVKG